MAIWWASGFASTDQCADFAMTLSIKILKASPLGCTNTCATQNYKHSVVETRFRDTSADESGRWITHMAGR